MFVFPLNPLIWPNKFSGHKTLVLFFTIYLFICLPFFPPFSCHCRGPIGWWITSQWCFPFWKQSPPNGGPGMDDPSGLAAASTAAAISTATPDGPVQAAPGSDGFSTHETTARTSLGEPRRFITFTLLCRMLIDL